MLFVESMRYMYSMLMMLKITLEIFFSYLDSSVIIIYIVLLLFYFVLFLFFR